MSLQFTEKEWAEFEREHKPQIESDTNPPKGNGLINLPPLPPRSKEQIMAGINAQWEEAFKKKWNPNWTNRTYRPGSGGQGVSHRFVFLFWEFGRMFGRGGGHGGGRFGRRR